jgi:hypothetical protein
MGISTENKLTKRTYGLLAILVVCIGVLIFQILK